MKTYNFSLNTTSNPSNKCTNYSKILDDLIYDDIKEKNYYLSGNEWFTPKHDDIIDNIIGEKKNTITIINGDCAGCPFKNACKLFKNYNTNKNKLKFKTNTLYYIGDTPIMLFDDSIQIGFDLYYFKDFDDLSFLESLSQKIKKTIATIYIDGLKITIKK